MSRTQEARSWAEFDWERYTRGEYSPPPELVKLPDWESFWEGLGGTHRIDEKGELVEVKEKK